MKTKEEQLLDAYDKKSVSVPRFQPRERHEGLRRNGGTLAYDGDKVAKLKDAKLQRIKDRLSGKLQNEIRDNMR